MSSLNKNRLPNHIAIIMDGNGRWATAHDLPRIEGHRKGAEAARRIIEICIENKIPYLTLYVFSTENWNRPRSEIDGLFKLIELNLDNNISIAMKLGVKIRHIGKLDGLPGRIKNKLAKALKTTAHNKEITLLLAFNYGGRDEIVNAVKKIITNRVSTDGIDETLINNNLYTADIPDPDLVIRTGGEKRISNFLIWQLAYSEIYFTDVLWPEFNAEEFSKAVSEYSRRHRRFGSLVEHGVKS